ncbi:glycoside hydrolase family 1 protein [Salinispira pacifica]
METSCTSSSTFSRGEETLRPFSLPQGLLLGTATAATQIEGGDLDHSWSRWARAGNTADGSLPSPADDHWNRVEEDVRLLRELGCRVYRMSVEWARIEPSPGNFDSHAMQRYRSEIESLRAAGIEPLVTLHHFTNPIWFEEAGGWLSEEAPRQFERFAGYVVDALCDLVGEWVVINEPNVFALNGYMLGEWPPGHSSLGEYLRCARNMIRAHKSCYRLVHRIRSERGYSDTMVGSAIHFRVFDPAGPGPLDRFASAAFTYLFHHAFVEGVIRGRFTLPLKRLRLPGRHRKASASQGASAFVPRPSGQYSDFIAVNYYSREIVKFGLGGDLLVGRRILQPGLPRNDLGWEIYPDGLRRVACAMYRKYHLPVYVTENGTCDAEDRFRARYIYEHLRALKELRDEGIDVRRYYHWTAFDNFEWAEGVSARFGLVEVDFGTQERRIRASGRLFARIAAEAGVTEQCLNDFRESLRYRGSRNPKTAQ